MLSISKKFGSLERAVDAAIKFHGKGVNIPGVVIGTYMLDFGLKKFYEIFSEKSNEPIKFSAVCENTFCLPDVIQSLLNLTYGNRYLTVIDKDGKFAFSLYDREDRKGVRIFIDITGRYNVNNIQEKFPNIFKFFTRTRDPRVLTDKIFRQKSNEDTVNEFLNAKEEDRNKIFGWKKVHVNLPRKVELLPAKICPICGESFLSSDKDAEICSECSNRSFYYRVL